MRSFPSNALKIRAYRSLDELQGLLPEWETLLLEYPLATTFSTWEWLASWWRNFARQDELLVLGFERDGHLIGLVPLAITRQKIFGTSLRILRFMGDGSGDSDNLDLLVRPGEEQVLASSLLDYLLRNRAAWDICQLNTLPPDSPAITFVRAQAKVSGWVAYEYGRSASAIPLPATWEEYLRQLSSEDQKNLGRYSRRLEKRYQVRLYKCSREEELPRVLEAMFKLHQARWETEGESGSFADAARRHFYYDLSRDLLARGWLELWVLELDGEIASAQYAFRYGNTVFQLQEGNDPARASDRVGFILRGQVLQQLIAEGVRVYDFLGGEPGYKARWGAKESYYRNVHLARRLSLGGVVLMATHYLANYKKFLRRQLPSSVWGTLHRVNLALRGKKGLATQAKGDDGA